MVSVCVNRRRTGRVSPTSYNSYKVRTLEPHPLIHQTDIFSKREQYAVSMWFLRIADACLRVVFTIMSASRWIRWAVGGQMFVGRVFVDPEGAPARTTWHGLCTTDFDGAVAPTE